MDRAAEAVADAVGDTVLIAIDADQRREQEVFLNAIRKDTDLTEHWQSAIDSLRVVLAADQSFKEGRTIKL